MPIWQRNLYIIGLAEFVSMIGFNVIQPFIPYFIGDLGVTNLSELEFYSGLSLSLHSLAMAVFAPIWGVLGDRLGRKAMVERAIFGGAILFFLNGFVQDVPSLMVLRTIQGVFTGTVTAATALVANGTPRERSGYALGILQLSIHSGSLLGPLIGGVVADAWGYRAAFFVTSAILLVGGVLVIYYVKEDFRPQPKETGRVSRFGNVPMFLFSAVLLPVFVLRVISRFGDRTVSPILPLFIESILPADAKVATTTGLIIGASAAFAALGAFLFGRMSDRISARLILMGCLGGSAVLNFIHFFVQDPFQLLILQALLGFLLGGTLTSLSSTLARVSPPGREGLVYGVDASLVSVANTVAPMTGAGIAVGFGMRPAFLFAAGTCVVSLLTAARFIRTRPVSAASGPAAEKAIEKKGGATTT